MRVLGIDTSTLIASVAVVEDDDDAPRVLASADGDTASHSADLLDLVDRVLRSAGLASADLDAIAVGAGPGSFTGLRIGMATAKGLAFASGKPLWVVSSLAALAHDYLSVNPDHTGAVAAVLDARRQEIFAGLFERGPTGVAARGAERVLAPAALAQHLIEEGVGGAVLVGDGLDAYPSELSGVAPAPQQARRTPSGAAVAILAVRGDRRDALAAGTPVYIRPSEAEVRFPDGNPGGTFARKR
jgi:tRNA threonylcarbamoyladenosine biosynthesis protein TsaB